MLEQLWAGWRSGYVKSVDDDPAAPCLFCHLPDASDDAALILQRGETCFSVLNRFPYTTGHLMVAPYRHTANLSDLTTAEQAEVWDLLISAEASLSAAMRPSGFNLGANLGRVAGAGIPGHLHFHLVPRWSGDTNFMTATGNTRVLPESLEETWTNLRAGYRVPMTDD